MKNEIDIGKLDLNEANVDEADAEQKSKKGLCGFRFDYKWVVIGVCFLMVFTTLGFCNSTKSLFLDKVTAALDIKRSAFSLNDSFRYVASVIANIFFGSLVAKFGARTLISAGFVSLTASMVLCAVANQVWVFYIAGILLGLGLSWTTTTMVGYVVTKWSRENKGTIMGFILAASGVGGATAIQIVSPVIESETNPFAYRNAYFLIAAILLAVGAIVVILFRNNPKGAAADKKPYVKTRKKSKNSWDGLEFSKATRKIYFWGACVCVFFSGIVLQGFNGIVKAHMCDVGIDSTYVALVLTMCSLFLALFKFLTGVVYDKFGIRTTATIASVSLVITMAALIFVSPTPFGKVLAMSYAIFAPIAFPLDTIMLPIYSSDLFGEKSFEKMLGIFVSLNYAGFACSAPLMNFCYDKLGSYHVALVASAVISVGIVIGLQLIISASQRQRRALESEG